MSGRVRKPCCCVLINVLACDQGKKIAFANGMGLNWCI